MSDTASSADDRREVQTLEKMPLPELEERVGFSADGLTDEESARRRERYGANEIAEKKVSPLLSFLHYFWGPIPWMIEAAALLSALIRRWPDFGIIMALLLANACVGFWEEHQAGNAIAALKSKLALMAKVKRDGRWRVVPARELVPGDLIRLRLGDIVPADTRMLSADPLTVDQSALTGESLPVTRAEADALYGGSIIRQGEADAVVFATGPNTYMGRTAHLVEEAHVTSHFQKAVLQIGDYLIVIAGLLVILIVAVALFRGDRLSTTLQFALVLTVAAIPVAMPTVLSVTMAVGARLLARKDAVVSRLAAVEEMAGMDVLCSDKTGTLTQNRISLGTPFSTGGTGPGEVVLQAALASREEDQDPIDLAVIASVTDRAALRAYRVRSFTPFDPVRKRTEADVEDVQGAAFRVTKGAPQVVFALVEESEEELARAKKAVEAFASRGFRSLGVARTDSDGRWRLSGVLPLFDPPRTDSKATVAQARRMGIDVKMITGDQLPIAREIARQVGLGTNILEASFLEERPSHQTGQTEREIEACDGFAQVFPEHKFHVVDVLQRRHHITGMTGDGVNDAPALKQADVGIAVSGATDAARSAADIVLMTPGLSVIIDAVRESRKIFERMSNYAIYRIAETIRVLLLMTLAILIFNFYPITAVMIVLLALLNDGAILSIAYDHVRPSDTPGKWNIGLVLAVSTVLGLAGLIESFGLFYLADRVFHLSRDLIQTLLYLKLSVAGHLTVFVARTRGPFWSVKPARVLVGAVIGTQLVATLLSVYGIFMPPIGWFRALLVWLYALSFLFVEDCVKLGAYRIFDSTAPGLLEAKGARRR